MSSSELSSAGEPSDATIEEELRRVVERTYKSGNHDELTVRRIRAAVEKSLGLEEGFLKEDTWKDRSKELIASEVGKQESGNNDESSKPSKSKPAPKPRVDKPASKRSAKTDNKPVKKRKLSKSNDITHASEEENDEPPKPVKRRSKKSAAIESSESELSDVPKSTSKTDGDEPEKTEETLGKNGASKIEENEQSSELSDVIDEEPKKPKKKAAPEPKPGDDSSELSDVIDEEPVKKRRKKSDASSSKPKSAGKKGRPKPSEAQDLDPDEAEIKKLKGWLVQCGIRKMWWKELQPYETPKAKIRHLKEMLSDIGMTGRYSKEKALQIRDRRELEADLEAVQVGNKYWGRKKEEEEKETGARPKRQLAKGLEGLDFLNDDDGEETD